MQVDTRHRFDNFVVGSANRLAVAAARAVAESPGRVYNPLFLYSESGLGKTHLMGAVGNAVLERHEGVRVEYVTLDDFVSELHAAVGAGGREEFAQRWESVGVLLIDDVQFLTGQRETQSEILRLLNALQWGHNQIVMASDRPPTEIADVDERLVTRLSGGLVVDIGPPDFETRVAILRAKAVERAVQFAPGVVEAVAELSVANVRELQGALNRLAAHQAIGSGTVEAHEVAAIIGAPVERASAPAGVPGLPGPGEFESFLTGIATAVSQHVESWRARVAETVAQWSAEGYRTTALEPLLDEPEAPPHWEAVIRGFVAVIERLRAYEAQATAIDASVAGHPLFRDPERVHEAEQLVERVLASTEPPPSPAPEWQRAAFEVSASNQLAARAADAVIAEPGARYNPLFVHGSPGTGKTHLLHAIGNELVQSTGGAARVAVVRAQEFMNELIAALQEGAVGRWRARYRAVDALLVDDVQFIAGKERTQEELFHLFNALHGEGKQVVLTSDRTPKELDGIEQRLRSRFEGGLVAALDAPDDALRERLVARILGETGAEADPAAITELAGRPARSGRRVRELVEKAIAAAGGASITRDIVCEALDGPSTAQPVAEAPRAVRQVAPAGGESLFLDDEKMVLDWPDVSGRVIEELR